IVHLASNVPLYIQIAEHLISKIETGEFKPGDKLPTERALNEHFNVQRATIRQALGVLEARGLILRKRGSGTFVAKAKIEREARRLFAFTRIMTLSGYKVGANILSVIEAKANARIAAKLKIAADSLVYHYHRLRCLDDEPVMLEIICLPKHIFPGMDQQDLVNNSLFEIMKTAYGREITSAEQALEAVQASDYEAKVLEVSPGAALMMEERISRDQFGTIIEFSRDLYRGDRFRFIVQDARFDIEIK
ncbi:GntR family transcriptional regulator, partial [Neptuniibacter sp.]|uniref:GntR family transcriptional regulator n=1 Tax=Neptuniibacter sp. TaxID=1962643 RepID=UPI002626A651